MTKALVQWGIGSMSKQAEPPLVPQSPAAGEPGMLLNRENFRASMRHLASGVCVITTTTQDGRRWGLTATAVCSVSADPPTLLACVNSATSTCAAILSAKRFAVNLLSADDRHISNRFASPIPPEQRFTEGQWGTLATGAPVLESSLAVFDCTLGSALEVSTHRILLGNILALRPREASIKPLLYAHGAYASTAELDTLKGVTLGALANRLSSDPDFLEDCMHWGLF
jgi:flavin reductase (NADH)/flavin reductase